MCKKNNMVVSIAKIECQRINDWESFHDEFDRVFGFPDFYGRNMNAWIDCLTAIDSPEDGMTRIHCENGKCLTIKLENARSFKERCPEQYAAVVECSAFVNWRRIEQGESSVLALSFYD